MANTGTALTLLAGLVTATDGGALKRFHFAEPHMGTTFQVTLYAAEEPTARSAARDAFARAAQLDEMMSDYRPSSQLMRLCRQAGGPPVQVSPELFQVLAEAEKISRLSDGAFDVTVGPLVHIWRRARRTQLFPEPGELDKARALVGYQNILLDPGAGTVRLTKPGMLLDLGGIAKGYAADEMLAVLRRHGISRALVAAGGDIAASDAPPDAGGWRVGVVAFGDTPDHPGRYLSLAHAAVSTSGEAEQFVDIGGKRYSHIVDPRTGVALTGRRSVTVFAPKGILADSLTKVVSVLGPERGLSAIAQVPGASALVVEEQDGARRTYASKDFPKPLKEVGR